MPSISLTFIFTLSLLLHCFESHNVFLPEYGSGDFPDLFALSDSSGFEPSTTIEPIKETGINCEHVPFVLLCKDDRLAKECDVLWQCERYQRANKGKKPLISVVFMGLCPYAMNLISKQINHAHTSFGNRVEFEVLTVAVEQDGTLQCPHGDEECQFQFHILCANKYYSQQIIPFLTRIFSFLKHNDDWKKAIDRSYDILRIPQNVRDQIGKCAQTDEGHNLQTEVNKRIDGFWPEKPTTSPWIVYNNVSLPVNKQDYLLRLHLPTLICDSLVGSKLPEYCSW